MKKIVALIVVLAFVLTAMPAFAAKGGTRGASQQAYDNASDKAVFNRVGDWFATRGKSPEEKEKIVAERDAKRAAKKAEKEARKLEKQAQKKAKTLEKQSEVKARKAGKEVKKTKRGLKKKYSVD